MVDRKLNVPHRTSYSNTPPKNRKQSFPAANKKVDQQVTIEPTDLLIEFDPSQRISEQETITLRNFGNSSIYFNTRSTNTCLKPQPHSSYLAKFDSLIMTLHFHCSETPLNTDEIAFYYTRKDRIGFDWIRLPQDHPKNDSKNMSKMIANVPREDRFHATIEKKYPIPEEDVAAVRSAFIGTCSEWILIGDFENEIVNRAFEIRNNVSKRVLWNIKASNNVLLKVAPVEGVMEGYASVKIVVTCESFHVGKISDAYDRMMLEWTAAPNELRKYSKKVMYNAPKIFRVPIKICYKYTENISTAVLPRGSIDKRPRKSKKAFSA